MFHLHSLWCTLLTQRSTPARNMTAPHSPKLAAFKASWTVKKYPRDHTVSFAGKYRVLHLGGSRTDQSNVKSRITELDTPCAVQWGVVYPRYATQHRKDIMFQHSAQKKRDFKTLDRKRLFWFVNAFSEFFSKTVDRKRLFWFVYR